METNRQTDVQAGSHAGGQTSGLTSGTGWKMRPSTSWLTWLAKPPSRICNKSTHCNLAVTKTHCDLLFSTAILTSSSYPTDWQYVCVYMHACCVYTCVCARMCVCVCVCVHACMCCTCASKFILTMFWVWSFLYVLQFGETALKRTTLTNTHDILTNTGNNTDIHT